MEEARMREEESRLLQEELEDARRQARISIWLLHVLSSSSFVQFTDLRTLVSKVTNNLNNIGTMAYKIAKLLALNKKYFKILATMVLEFKSL